jgi:hypothetical protein
VNFDPCVAQHVDRQLRLLWETLVADGAGEPVRIGVAHHVVFEDVCGQEGLATYVAYRARGVLHVRLLVDLQTGER